MTTLTVRLAYFLVACAIIAPLAPTALAQESRWPWQRPSASSNAAAGAESGSSDGDVGRIRRSTADPATDEESARFIAALAEAGTIHPAGFVGGILVGPEGMTLYTFGRDLPGASTCYRVCERLWPPLSASLDDEPVGDFTIIERLHGGLQWAIRGEPLYYWVNDRRPGDITGDNVNEVWFVIREDAVEAGVQ